ncbi:hypothetical protein C7B67_29390 [filamentous cyanobacterium Phorm 6]|nr:hypothetical protein C7B67_29390 [filamentous cyanobacterium Phorm 6]
MNVAASLLSNRKHPLSPYEKIFLQSPESFLVKKSERSNFFMFPLFFKSCGLTFFLSKRIIFTKALVRYFDGNFSSF